MNYEELKEKRIKELTKRFEEASLIEDLKFREIAKSKEAIEEILRTILNDENLKVIKTIEQKNKLIDVSKEASIESLANLKEALELYFENS